MVDSGTAQRGGGGRLVGVEGLRAIAASSILVYHVWLYGAPAGGSVELGPLTKGFDNLRAGVTLFFVLSGFLLFRPYVAAALRGGRIPSLSGYLRNRALRILPAYWVILLAVAVLMERELLHSPKQLLANAFLLQNYIPTYTFGSGIVPAWSLAIEIVFYACVPVLGLLAIRLARRAGANKTIAAFVPVAVMAGTGIAAKVALHVFDLGHVWSLSFLSHADWFAAGMAVAVLRIRWEDGSLRLPRYWRPFAVLTAAALIAGALKLYYQGTLSGLEYQTPIAVACGIVLSLVVFAEPKSKLVAGLSWRPLYALGLASYSLFLWHDPLVRSLRDAGLMRTGTGGFVLNVCLIAVISVALSALTYLFVERPALARKKSWQRAQPGVDGAQPAKATVPPTTTELVAAPAASAAQS